MIFVAVEDARCRNLYFPLGLTGISVSSRIGFLGEAANSHFINGSNNTGLHLGNAARNADFAHISKDN